MSDLSGIIDQDKNAITKWMSDTITFALLSNLGDPINENEVDSNDCDRITAGIKKSTSLKDLVSNTITAARRVIHEADDHNHDEVPMKAVYAVNDWILRSLAVADIAIGKAFTTESLEADADSHIFKPIQGNRRGIPKRVDLDKLVRRTIEYVGEIVEVKLEEK